MKEIQLLQKEKEEEYEVFIKYVQVECKNCGRVWGWHMPEGEPLPERQLVCMKCTVDAAWEKKNQKL
jgi:hypothetical protein